MTKATGDKYRVVVRPPRRVWKKLTGSKLLLRDTAMIINTETMKKASSKSGSLRTGTSSTREGHGQGRVLRPRLPLGDSRNLRL